MKRAIALMLCLFFSLTAFFGCASDEDDKGAIIHMFVSSEIKSFDPATAYTNSDSIKMLGLIYEGLFKLTSDGKVQKGMVRDYDIVEEDDDPDNPTYTMQITLKESQWSDGTPVQADDFIFSFKRILDPSFSSDAAILLYDIKNAKAVKEGNMSIDALGITAPDTDELEIEFEGKIDYDAFIENLTSPALVPLREDKVYKPATDEAGTVLYDENDMMIYDTTWATKATMLVCNGPFSIKTMDETSNKEYVLERNKYYMLDFDDDDNGDKYVKPYRIIIHYDYFASGNDGLTQLLNEFAAGTVFYLANLPLSAVEQYREQMEISDLFSTGVIYFNNTNPLFEVKEIRRALSMALDRNEIVALTGNINAPATGIVPLPVYNTKYKTTFRDVQGDVISASADIESAKALINSVTIPKDADGNAIRTISLVCRSNALNYTDGLVAEYIKEQWSQLGFNVQIDARGTNQFNTALTENNYDVIMLDYQTTAPSALSCLAPFAINYSGAGKDIINSNFDAQPNRSGYTSEAYDALITEALALAPYSEERAQKLAEAERLLMEDMPIIPLQFYREYYISQELSGIKSSLYGYRVFNKTKLKNYKDYLPETEE